MKKVLCVLAVLAIAATASATVRVFVTNDVGVGLNNPANAHQPSYSTVLADGSNSNAYDYSDYYGVPTGNAFGTDPTKRYFPAAYPPVNAPSGTVGSPVQINPGQFAYIWLQFENEAKGANINGLLIKVAEHVSGIVPSGSAPGYDFAYYVMNNKNCATAPATSKRWDGTVTQPSVPEFSTNPQTLVSVQAMGITNAAAAANYNLFDGTTRIALLGAIVAPFDNMVYDITIENISYASGTPGGVTGGVFQFTPEPTSLLLMALAGLLFRRR